MTIKIRKHEFKIGNKKNFLCPLCLEELKEYEHSDCFPKGIILNKKENYALVKVVNNEPIIERMLTISDNKDDNSKYFIILYVNKSFVGYKGFDQIWFISDTEEEEYKNILKDYIPKSERVKNTFKTNNFAYKY